MTTIGEKGYNSTIPTSNGCSLTEFSSIFDHWLAEKDRDLQSLRDAAAAAHRGNESASDERLIQLVLSHYENYYSLKHASAACNVLPMFSPSWTSSTENLFLWAAGWRPSMAFHLLYSKSGLQLETGMHQLILGLPTDDLADLSSSQMDGINKLQAQTIEMEREITEEKAAAQESVANTEMVDLSHKLTEGEGEEEMMNEEVGKTREMMRGVLEKADKLRLETLKEVVKILKPLQALHFLIAAAELHLRIHEFGESQDDHSRAS